MKERVTFYLKKPDATSETLIYAFLHFHRQRVKLSTELKTHPNTWNARKYRLKASAMHAGPMNQRLDRIAEVLGSIYLSLLNEPHPVTPAEIKARYVVLMRPLEPQQSLVESYQSFVDFSGDRLRRATLQVHQTVINHLKAFQSTYNIQLTFARVDSLFFEKLVGYLIKVAKLNNVTTWKVIKALRAYLRWAMDQGLTDNTEYQRFTKKRLPSGESSDKVYLTIEELQRVMSLDLRANERLDRTRDLFIFQAHTGLRYGDIFSFKPESVQGDTIRLVTSKNRKSISIPLLPAAKAILTKYEGRLPRISNQKQNTYLKEVMAAAGIDSSVVVVDYKGIERIEKTRPKYELIGTHSAKRTFVTILRQRGISVETIMKITGNTRRTIDTYIVNTEADAAREVSEAWV